MLSRRFHRVLLAALAALVLCAGLGPARAAASDDSADTSDVTTITTVLHPGWNMVGWVGPTTLVSDLYDSLPALRLVSAWNASMQQYQRLRRTGVSSSYPLLPGDGLWLYVDGTATVEWSQSLSDDRALLELRAGRNLVGWTGDDETPVGDAVARFGEAVERVWHWDAAEQEYRLYHPKATTNSFSELNRGDAFWIYLSRDLSWWQSGTGRTEFVFKGDIPPELRASFLEEMGSIITFFAERYGIEPPEFTVFVDSNSPWSAAAGRDIWLHARYASSPSIIVVQYLSMLESHLGHRSGPPFWPFWLSVGISQYAADLYQREREGRTYEDIRAGRVAGFWWHSPEPVDLGERRWTVGAAPAGVVSVGALAVEWLVGHAAAYAREVDFMPLEPGGLDLQGESDAFIEYFRPQRSASTWEAAFKRMFGIAAEDFHDAFGEYLSALLDRSWPHRRDDRSAPVVVYLQDVPYQKQVEIDSVLRDAETFFSERFSVSGADYTLIVGAQDGKPLREAYRLLWGKDLDYGLCETNRAYVYLAALECLHTGQVIWRYQQVLFQQLIPSGPQGAPRTDDGRDPRGPRWFSVGVAAYMSGVHPLLTADTEWSAAVHRAKWTALLLSSMETYAGEQAVQERSAFDSLSFLAVWWLAEFSGERNIFEYYRLLPESETWEEAFEGAFGRTVDDFYGVFEAYRARVAPPDDEASSP